MHDEATARRLWCPMARVRSFRHDGDPAYVTKTCYANGENRGVPNGSANCIASSCAMWQWVDDEFEYLFSPPENDEWTHAPYLSGEGRKCDRWQREKKNRRGFCGLSRPFYIPTGNCGGGKP